MNTLTLHASVGMGVAEFSSLHTFNTSLKGVTRVITYIRGNRQENLFNGLYELNIHNVKEWFVMLDQYKALNAEGRAAVQWLIVMLPNGCSMSRAIELAPKVHIYNGYEIDYVREFVNDTFNMAHKLGHLTKYFDYAGYCFDLQKDKKIDKVVYDGQCYTVTNADNFNVWGI